MSYELSVAQGQAKAFRRQWLDAIADGNTSEIDCLSIELAYRGAKLQASLIQLEEAESSEDESMRAWIPCIESKAERYTRQRNAVRAAFIEAQKEATKQQEPADNLPANFVMATAFRADLKPECNAARQWAFLSQINEASEVYGNVVNAGIGSWQGVQEQSFCIDVASAHPRDAADKVTCIMDMACGEWQQDAVLYVDSYRDAYILDGTGANRIGEWVEVSEKEAKACIAWTAMFDLQADAMRFYIVK